MYVLCPHLLPAITGTEDAEEQCGRVLGLQFHHDNTHELYALDGSNGLVKINVDTKEIHTLFQTRRLDGSVPFTKFVNDLAVLPNGSIFFTDSSKKFSRRENRMEVLECRANGQLLHYNPTDSSVHVAGDGIHFANGICPSTNGDSLLICETTMARIMR